MFGDCMLATAILERVLRDAVTFAVRGNSYHLKERLKAGLLRPHDDEVDRAGKLELPREKIRDP